METTFRIQGLTQLLEKERTFGARVEGELTTALEGVGEIVARDVRSVYQGYSEKGAAGVRTKVFVGGVFVVQTLQKSRDPMKQRRNFGPLMWRKAFGPAARDNETKVVEAAAAAVETARIRYWEAP